MSRIDKLHAGWMMDSAYRKEYDALEGQFALAVRAPERDSERTPAPSEARPADTKRRP